MPGQSAILLGEFVVHGHDIARSIGRRWPIDPALARLIIAALTAVLPRYVDRANAGGLTATYEVRLRGGPSFQVRFDRGTATVGLPQPGAADCRLTADPVTFLLVAYGRRSQWPGILRGQLLAWGRRRGWARDSSACWSGPAQPKGRAPPWSPSSAAPTRLRPPTNSARWGIGHAGRAAR